MMSEDFSRNAGVLGRLEIPLGLGLLRLSTEGRPEEEEAVALIHEAFDLGIRLLDTAESYGLNHKDLHYGEVLAKKALDSWDGPRDEVKIITKVGMARPKGKWKPAASASDLRKGVLGSLEALETDELFLVQLHVKDSRVPFEESLSALAELQSEGKIRHIGLCNVGPLEVYQAQRHFPVVSVQNELSVLSQTSAKNGMVEIAKRLEIPFLAHRPLGGYAKVEKLYKNRTLKPVVARHDKAPHEIALKTLLDAAPHIIPLVGATRLESIRSSVRALQQEFDQEDRDQLAKKFTFQMSDSALKKVEARVTPDDLPQLEAGAGPGEHAEVVLVTGIQGAGKSSLVNQYVDAGFVRLNRDDLGGSLDDMVDLLEQHLSEGKQQIVLDNTYPTRVSRSQIITTAHHFGVPVRCRYLATSPADALVNVCQRVLDRYGRLLSPDEMKQFAKEDPNLPPPGALRQYRYIFEKPELNEGFSVVDEIPFERRENKELTEKGLILDVDGTLRLTKSGEVYPRHPDDIELLPGRTEHLQTWIDEGYSLFFLSNQSGVHSGKLTKEDADACFERTIELLDLPITEITYCPHSAFPVACYCRKPMPGIGVYLMNKYKLDPKKLVMVGDMKSDAEFAEGLSIRYHDAEEFFGEKVSP